MQGKVVYIAFDERFNGIKTSIKIFETDTNLSIFIAQEHPEVHLYSDIIKGMLMEKSKIAKRKKLDIICNLGSYENLEDVCALVCKIMGS